MTDQRRSGVSTGSRSDRVVFVSQLDFQRNAVVPLPVLTPLRPGARPQTSRSEAAAVFERAQWFGGVETAMWLMTGCRGHVKFVGPGGRK
jgi:hypothetical protein